MASTRHNHEWTLMYAHLGKYGRQDVHYHVCFDARCGRLLIGDGRSCDGDPTTHWHEKRMPAGGGTDG